MTENQNYAAFISYAHADEKVAGRLHEALETYDLPDGVVVNGRDSITPIFRDVTELTAAHSLSEKIQDALQRSRYLIVLCSPAAKASHWVNEEIRLFREIHGDKGVLAAIVDGTPSTAFPEALTEDGREPLAANLMQGRDRFRFGVHQLAASLLGVGLDSLVQRAEKRRRLRARLITAATSVLAIVMGGLAYTAFDARDAAEKSRDDAERLVEYMVSDLKSELYSLQRLDILDGLGEEIVAYYEGIDPQRLPDDRLVKLIAAIQSLSEVAIEEREFERAARYLADASQMVEILEKREPDSDDSLFYRAQNEFWEGLIYKRQRMWDEALPYWQRYNDIGQELFARDTANPKWAMEAGWGAKNLSILYRSKGDFETAQRYAYDAMETFEIAFDENPDDIYFAYEHADIISAVSDSEEKFGNVETAINLRKRALKLISDVRSKSTIDYKAEYYYNQSLFRLRESEGKSICNHSDFDEVFKQSKAIWEYEPQNTRFLEEYIRQRFKKIFSCLKSNPEKVDPEEIKYLMDLARKTNENWAKDYSAELKKLRAKDPEPLD